MKLSLRRVAAVAAKGKIKHMARTAEARRLDSPRNNNNKPQQGKYRQIKQPSMKTTPHSMPLSTSTVTTFCPNSNSTVSSDENSVESLFPNTKRVGLGNWLDPLHSTEAKRQRRKNYKERNARRMARLVNSSGQMYLSNRLSLHLHLTAKQCLPERSPLRVRRLFRSSDYY